MRSTFRKYKDSLIDEQIEPSHYKQYNRNIEEYRCHTVRTIFTEHYIEDLDGYIHEQSFLEKFRENIIETIVNNENYTDYFFEIIELKFNYDGERNLYSNPLSFKLITKDEKHIAQLTQILFNANIICEYDVIKGLELVRHNAETSIIYSKYISYTQIDLSNSEKFLIDIKPEYFYKVHIFDIKDTGLMRLDGEYLEIITAIISTLPDGSEVPAGSTVRMPLSSSELNSIMPMYSIDFIDFKQNILNILKCSKELKDKYVDIVNITKVNYIDLEYTSNPRFMDIVVKEKDDIYTIIDILANHGYIDKISYTYPSIIKINQFEKDKIESFDTISRYYHGDPKELANLRYLEETAECLGYEEEYEYDYDDY